MSALDLFSERNILNSTALYFAQQLLDWGFLVYWQKIDAIQTPEGTYTSYTTNSTGYLADSVFLGRINGSMGIVTMTADPDAMPKFPTGPTQDGTVATAERVQIPCFAIDVGPDVPLAPYEFGTRQRWRVRALGITGLLRTADEAVLFSDKLAQWFDEDFQLPVEDHDNVSGELPEYARVTRRLVTKNVIENMGQTDRYPLELNARLEFVA